MSLLIELIQNVDTADGIVHASYEVSWGNDVNAEIKVYVNSSYLKTLPVVAKSDAQSIEVCQLNSKPGYNTHVKVEILAKGSGVVSDSSDRYYSGFAN